MNPNNTSARVYFYDFLRILACFLVIVNHTIGSVFIKHFPSPSSYLSLIYFFTCKIAVPIFLMLTGALLLNRQESLKTLFTKRILRMVIALFVFSFIVYLMPFVKRLDFTGFNPAAFLVNTLKEPIKSAYWYLYMLIGLLLCLPLLRKMIAGFEIKDYIYYFILLIAFVGIIQAAGRHLKIPMISGYFAIPLIATPLGYAIFGHFAGNIIGKETITKKMIVWAWVVFIVGTALSVALTVAEYNRNGKFLLTLDNYSSALIMLPSAAIFLMARYYVPKIKISPSAGKVITSVSMTTFGIYMMHIILIDLTSPLLKWLNSNINDLFAVVIYEIFIFVLSYGATKVLQQIPYIKKIL